MSKYDPKCENCTHWVRRMDPEIGKCVRHSPIVFVNEYKVPLTSWPTTYQSDKCGDFEPK